MPTSPMIMPSLTPLDSHASQVEPASAAGAGTHFATLLADLRSDSMAGMAGGALKDGTLPANGNELPHAATAAANPRHESMWTSTTGTYELHEVEPCDERCSTTEALFDRQGLLPESANSNPLAMLLPSRESVLRSSDSNPLARRLSTHESLTPSSGANPLAKWLLTQNSPLQSGGTAPLTKSLSLQDFLSLPANPESTTGSPDTLASPAESTGPTPLAAMPSSGEDDQGWVDYLAAQFVQLIAFGPGSAVSLPMTADGNASLDITLTDTGAAHIAMDGDHPHLRQALMQLPELTGIAIAGDEFSVAAASANAIADAPSEPNMRFSQSRLNTSLASTAIAPALTARSAAETADTLQTVAATETADMLQTVAATGTADVNVAHSATLGRQATVTQHPTSSTVLAKPVRTDEITPSWQPLSAEINRLLNQNGGSSEIPWSTTSRLSVLVDIQSDRVRVELQAPKPEDRAALAGMLPQLTRSLGDIRAQAPAAQHNLPIVITIDKPTPALAKNPRQNPRSTGDISPPFANTTGVQSIPLNRGDSVSPQLLPANQVASKATKPSDTINDPATIQISKEPTRKAPIVTVQAEPSLEAVDESVAFANTRLQHPARVDALSSPTHPTDAPPRQTHSEPKPTAGSATVLNLGANPPSDETTSAQLLDLPSNEVRPQQAEANAAERSSQTNGLGMSSSSPGTPPTTASNAAMRFPPLPITMAEGNWAQALADRVRLTVGSDQKAQIQLDPPELGKLEINVRMDGERAHIGFTAPTAAVREALETALPRLREMLAGQGLSLGDVNVSGQSHRQDSSNQSGAGNQSNIRSLATDNAEREPDSSAAEPTRTPWPDNRFEAYA